MGLFGLFFSEEEIKRVCAVTEDGFFYELDLLVGWKNGRHPITGKEMYCPLEIRDFHAFWKRGANFWELVVFGRLGDSLRDLEFARNHTHPDVVAFFKLAEYESFVIGNPFDGIMDSASLGIRMYSFAKVYSRHLSEGLYGHQTDARLANKAKQVIAADLNEKIRKRYPNERIIIPEE